MSVRRTGGADKSRHNQSISSGGTSLLSTSSSSSKSAGKGGGRRSLGSIGSDIIEEDDIGVGRSDDEDEAEVLDEEVIVDLKEASKAFARGLTRGAGWGIYLDELEKRSIGDSALNTRTYMDAVLSGFLNMRNFCEKNQVHRTSGSSSRGGQKLAVVPTFDEFGFDRDLLNRVAYIIIQLDGASPKSSNRMIHDGRSLGEGNSFGGGTGVDDSRRDSSGLVSSIRSEEVAEYEDDFENIDGEDEDEGVGVGFGEGDGEEAVTDSFEREEIEREVQARMANHNNYYNDDEVVEDLPDHLQPVNPRSGRAGGIIIIITITITMGGGDIVAIVDTHPVSLYLQEGIMTQR